ncbi:hypothetical protein [Kitasatospora sp. NPDC093806]|uniref:hypothetical protein n=1 Tax=Kitasatospora sp. NPDC093806 TaxID=3155075 RepID=UPI00341341E8
MDCEEVMLTVRITAAERALLRTLARGHGADVSDVAVDGLLDVIPILHVLPTWSAGPSATAVTAASAVTGASAASAHEQAGAVGVAGAVRPGRPALPVLPGDAGVLRLLRVLARPAPCAVTLWLPAPVADLLPLLGERITAVSGLRTGPASAALAAALRLWLAGDPQRLAAGLATLHRQGAAPGLAAQRLDVAA